MRHRKHNHLLGVKKQHRKALVSNLCAALIKHGRIETTLAKAKAIRPAVEKMITRAKKAKASDDPTVSLHHRRQCARHLRDKEAAHQLFNQKVDEFIDRSGGYVRIYKLGKVRLGDSAEMALVELVNGDDEGYAKRRKKKTAKTKKSDSVPPSDVQASGQKRQETEPEEDQSVEEPEKKSEEATQENIDDIPEEEPSEGQNEETEKPETEDEESLVEEEDVEGEPKASDKDENVEEEDGVEEKGAEEDESEPMAAEDNDFSEEETSDPSEAEDEDKGTKN